MRLRSSDEKTPWFDGATTCPDKDGPFEIQTGYLRPFFSFWNGTRWGSRERTLKDAMKYRHRKASGPVKQWRGFKEE